MPPNSNSPANGDGASTLSTMSVSNTSHVSKILVVGLENSGKTSIIMMLKGERNLLSFLPLKPTQRYKIDKLIDSGKEFAIWDLGGQKFYRKEYLDDFDKFQNSVKKLIYVIDIQDKQKYELSIEYLGRIIKKFGEIRIPEVLIFLHKFDPELENNDEYQLPALSRFIKQLRFVLKDQPGTQIFKTTIYTVFRKTSL
jgi:ADP-ribosylation factor family protein